MTNISNLSNNISLNRNFQDVAQYSKDDYDDNYILDKNKNKNRNRNQNINLNFNINKFCKHKRKNMDMKNNKIKENLDKIKMSEDQKVNKLLEIINEKDKKSDDFKNDKIMMSKVRQKLRKDLNFLKFQLKENIKKLEDKNSCTKQSAFIAKVLLKDLDLGDVNPELIPIKEESTKKDTKLGISIENYERPNLSNLHDSIDQHFHSKYQIIQK